MLSFLSAKDIPGSNNFCPTNIPSSIVPEELFCERTVKHYDQPIGVIVAESEKLAQRAALLVKVKYTNVKQRPVLTAAEAKLDPKRLMLFIAYPARDRGIDVQRVIKGDHSLYWQYMYHMETQTCVTRPNDDGVDVFPSTQWPNQVHVAISQVLNIQQSRSVQKLYDFSLSIGKGGGNFNFF